MTTRRWMIAVGMLAIVLGGIRETERLRRIRHEYLAVATEHLEAEKYFRNLAVRTRSTIVSGELSSGDSTKPLEIKSPVRRFDDRPLQVLVNEFMPADKSADVRFSDARARADALADRIRVLNETHKKKQVAHWQRQADYHAALGRKYSSAAARPWRAIEPDSRGPN
jgi:hypothetical protein